MLKTEEYEAIGKLVKGFAERICQGRRYAVLEGSYKHDVLGMNVNAFLDGMN
jgi:acetoin utilization deacetylase AcuC-like enzyme